jgi:beta-phosphoglucomutase
MMTKWIHDYDLFLFDFDGLLVNTEELHFQAYVQMCLKRGFDLKWNFNEFSLAAHYNSEGLKNRIYAALPDLYAQETEWSILYEEKKAAYLRLLHEGSVRLMPGVASLLQNLQSANIVRCVVTHSAAESIRLIRLQNPLLNTIPYWITREDYSKPKPNSECYEVAIKRYSNGSSRIIGFEDVPKGLNALLQTRAKPVLICSPEVDYLSTMRDVKHYASFEDISDKNRP